MPEAVYSTVVPHKKFAAPDGAVISISRSIHGYADDLAQFTPFGQERSHMGLVVLDFNHRHSLKICRNFPVGVARMLIYDQEVRFQGKKFHEMPDSCFFGLDGGRRIGIADVLAHDGLAVKQKSKGGL